MIDFSRQYHLGVRVADIDAAMADMGESLNLRWASVQHNPAQRVWTPDRGLVEVPLTYVYSCDGPMHVELLEGPPDTVWHAGDRPGAHHVGVWVDDVAAETTACLDQGWTLAAAGAPPEDGYGVFTYVVPPSGLIVELVWSAVADRFERWWAGAPMGNERDR
jgi:catechol 2,3-dioxygenase-like lactoylglutathione lyase family enzyme